MPDKLLNQTLRKLPVGPLDTARLGFVPLGYQNSPTRKLLPKDSAMRSNGEWLDWYCKQPPPVIYPEEDTA